MNTPAKKTWKNRKGLVGVPLGATLLVLAAALMQHRLDAQPASPGATRLTVSNARDAGPLTLRDAILAADRLSTRAHIQVSVPRIVIESPLPALTNPRGIQIEVGAEGVVIDASRLAGGVALQINAAGSVIKGLRITGAKGAGIVVNAKAVQLDGVTVSNSKVGILVGADATQAVVRSSRLENNETGLMAHPGVQGMLATGNTYAGNSQAGFWVVAPDTHPSARADAANSKAAEARVRIEDSLFERNAAGGVIGNQYTQVRRNSFKDTRQSAVTVLGGSARIEDNEIRGNVGTGINVISSSGVVLNHNTLLNNAATAISVRDSSAEITRNILDHNGSGIVVVNGRSGLAQLVSDNQVQNTAGDGITVIGGTPRLQRNQVSVSRAAALRVLELVQDGVRLKAEPSLDANVFTRNGSDAPVPGIYKVAATP